MSLELERAGLHWEPEIGDEVTERESLERVAILVDPQGLGPEELRGSFVWLPSVEQLIDQIMMRGGVLYHVGLVEEAMREDPCYEAVVKTPTDVIEVASPNLRIALGQTLCHLLSNHLREMVH